MRKLCLLLAALLLSNIAISQEKPKKLSLIGGMYLNAGYIGERNSLITGIGGKITLGLCPYFRIGSEGLGSSASYSQDGSFYSISWGGILFEGVLPYKKHRFIIGLTLGGGSNKEMEVIELRSSVNQPDKVNWTKNPLFIIAPFISYEYSLNKKVNLIAKVDFLTAMPSSSLLYSTPKLYLGCLFTMF